MEDKFLEFDVVIYYVDEQTRKFEEMGLEPVKEERIVKYSFDATKVLEIRQTFVNYKEEPVDAVVVTWGDNYETPPLMISYDEFKVKYNEYYKKDTSIKQGRIL